jgi:hypothetical protein
LSQRGIEKAKTGIDQQIDKMRQVIHEKTAPKPSAAQKAPPSSSPTDPAPASKPGPANNATPKSKGRRPVAKKRTTRRGKR